MEILKEIQLQTRKGYQTIFFGMVNNNQELQETFRLRYEVYSKKGYILSNLFPEKIEKDEYDEVEKCDYFIAKFENRIIGTARVIKDYYLPTEKDCFQFEEPQKIKEIPRDKRGEISRLIVTKADNESIPPFLVLLGIFDSILKFASKEDRRGGYSFIKESLRKKLKRINIPLHVIKPYTQIYSKKHLWGYFHDSADPVVPIYYLRDEAKEYLDKIFNNKKIFRKLGEKKFLYLLNKLWKFLFYIKLSRFFSHN